MSDQDVQSDTGPPSLCDNIMTVQLQEELLEHRARLGNLLHVEHVDPSVRCLVLRPQGLRCCVRTWLVTRGSQALRMRCASATEPSGPLRRRQRASQLHLNAKCTTNTLQDTPSRTCWSGHHTQWDNELAGVQQTHTWQMHMPLPSLNPSLVFSPGSRELELQGELHQVVLPVALAGRQRRRRGGGALQPPCSVPRRPGPVLLPGPLCRQASSSVGVLWNAGMIMLQ